uniref:Uncharacterized protein n=1 Tax=Moniliophthora roreri TaxID=221103 RepID=A0A0W0GD41_MONRR
MSCTKNTSIVLNPHYSQLSHTPTLMTQAQDLEYWLLYVLAVRIVVISA